MSDAIYSKKIFFLYPHSVIHNELIKLIIHYEYEVYLVSEHKKMFTLLTRYPDSVLFINIDEGLKEPEWEEYIRKLMSDSATSTVRIGIMSYEKNPELEKKYLLDVMVSCGFINLKLGMKESASIILKTLEVNEVKGRRKYVRVKCGDNNPATFNAKIDGRLEEGTIVDLSSAGMACTFSSRSLQFQPNHPLDDIQLRLKGALCKVQGTIMGSRSQGSEQIYVLMFAKILPANSKKKIQQFVYNSLQGNIDKELAGLKG